MMAPPDPKPVLERCAAGITQACQERQRFAKPEEGYVATLWEPRGSSIIWLCDECAAVIKSRRKAQ